MILDIVTYPNKLLFEVSKEVVNFDDEFRKFLDDMYDTMIASGGIGLAAIQVAKPLRALIVNLVSEDGEQKKSDLIEIINPQIIKKEGEICYQEGCLSVPGFYEDVNRAAQIWIKFQDRFGEFKELKAEALLSVAIQHEIDHLDGKLFIEKIGFNKRKKFDKEFQKKRKK